MLDVLAFMGLGLALTLTLLLFPGGFEGSVWSMATWPNAPLLASLAVMVQKPDWWGADGAKAV